MTDDVHRDEDWNARQISAAVYDALNGQPLTKESVEAIALSVFAAVRFFEADTRHRLNLQTVIADGVHDGIYSACVRIMSNILRTVVALGAIAFVVYLIIKNKDWLWGLVS